MVLSVGAAPRICLCAGEGRLLDRGLYLGDLEAAAETIYNKKNVKKKMHHTADGRRGDGLIYRLPDPISVRYI